MRWDGLFSDLESHAEALAAAERAGEIDERTRSEAAKLSLTSRLRAGIGEPVRLVCRADLQLSGSLLRVNPEWLLLAQSNGRESVVATAHILSVTGLGRGADGGGGSTVADRLGLRFILRRIARDRSDVWLHLIEGALSGTIDRVGADFLEIAVHPPGEARRRTAVSEVRLVPLQAVVLISRDVD